jgi:hypothetical protein
VRVGSIAGLPVTYIAAGDCKHLCITLNGGGKPVSPKSMVPDGEGTPENRIFVFKFTVD